MLYEEEHMSNTYRKIRFDDPLVQAQYDHLLQRIAEAEQARAPIAERHRNAERSVEDGSLSDEQFDAVDHEYIAANNTIAAAQRAVEDFLSVHRNYHTQ